AGLVANLHAHCGADGVAVALSPDEPQANALVAVELIVAIQVCRAAIGGNQNVEVTIVIEIAECGAACNFRLREFGPDLFSDVAKFATTHVEEEVRGLRILGVANGVVDVAVDDEQIELAVEVGIEEEAT